MNANYFEALEQQLALIREYSRASVGGFAGQAVRALAWSDPFYISGDISRFIERAGDCLPGGTIARTLLPVPQAFLLLERPLLIPVEAGVDEAVGTVNLEIAALSWAAANFDTPNPGYGLPKAETQGIAVTVFLRSLLSRRLDVGYQTTWRWGVEIDDVSSHAIEGSMPLNSSDAALMAKCRRFILALLFFIQQRILVAPKQEPERAARRRLERAGMPDAPAIRVVQLRRREPISAERPVGGADVHEWSCQWVVRGHWRQQWYAKAQRNQPIWITPYVKGPEDKPLRPPRSTVFAVVR